MNPLVIPRHRLVTNLLLVTALAACGDNGAGPESNNPASITVENDDLTLTQPGETVQLEITVRNASGDALPNVNPAFHVDDGTVVAVSELGVVQALKNGETRITVVAGVASADVTVTVAIGAVALQAGVPVSGLSGPESGYRYYTLQVPAGSDDKVLHVRLTGGTGDADLGLNQGGIPADDTYDCASTSGPNPLDNLEFCAVLGPAADTWHVVLFGFEAYAGVTLEASLVDVTDMASGTPVPDLSGARTQLRFFRLDVPPNSSLDLQLAGGTGDADLFATTAPAVSVTQIDGLDCLSAAEGNEENCALDPATAGTWFIFVLAWEAYEGATLTAQVGGGG